MKAYYKVILLIAIACTAIYQAEAQVYVGGTLTANTTWTSSDNPYIVVQDVIVPEGISLTILPGVIVKFQVETCIKVYGSTFVAKGSEISPILFTDNSTGPDIQRWSGIKFYNCLTQLDAESNYLSGTIISNSRIEGTTYAISIEDNSSVLIEKCELDNSVDAIFLANSNNNIIRNCAISNSNIGIFIPSNFESSNNRFSDNFIHHNSNVGFFMNNNDGLSKYNIIEGNHFDSNPIGIYLGNDGLPDPAFSIVQNNIISNSSLNGLRLYQDSAVVSENIFYNNLTGISIWESKFSRVANNLIFHNQDWGLQISGKAGYNSVEFNNIYENKGGILLSGQNEDSSHYTSIVRNAIHHNSGIAIRIESAPQAGIQFNNLYNNGTDSCFINVTRSTIHAEYNWWGTADTLLINKQISDIFDNPAKGHVIYKPFVGAPGSTPPISAPRNVVKRLAGDQVEVSWSPNQENDLDGYRVYYNYTTPYSFSDYVDVKNTTHYLLNGVSVFDTIAVTAYDSQADGNKDQFEGHESAFSFALLGPYAGADTSICYNNAFVVSGATAFKFSSLSWASLGDGSFDNANVLHPTYTPGIQDKASGQVVLTLTVINEEIQLTDQIQLILVSSPLAEAGPDATILQDSTFRILLGQAKFYDSIHWSTSGDGQYNDASALQSTYIPGPSDIENREVTLTLKATSACGSVSDDLILYIIPTYGISGKVHAGNMSMSRGTLSILRKTGNSFEPIRAGQVNPDGTFSLATLTGDSYLIYVMPDPVIYPEFLPTYYVSQLTWNDAYLLPLYANTFDLDIYLESRQFSLPSGVGSISGICTIGGGDDVIPSADVQSLTILLLDENGAKILGYTASSADGTFSFTDLPFGEYILKAEKSGYESISSPVIQVTPSFPDISGVQVSLIPNKITIAFDNTPALGLSELIVFPNPVNDLLHVLMPGGEAVTSYAISDAAGRQLPCYSDYAVTGNKTYFELNIKELEKGYYTLIINEKGSVHYCRFLKF
jgi:parallel beta-helix repeat protein